MSRGLCVTIAEGHVQMDLGNQLRLHRSGIDPSSLDPERILSVAADRSVQVDFDLPR